MIIPDIEGSRKCNYNEKYPAKMTAVLPFLQTCQQAYDEATAVLYGSNKFYFNDVPHPYETCNIVGCHFQLPLCDFVIMYAFLDQIGSGNRLKIQHLRLGFDHRCLTGFIERNRFVCDALGLLAEAHNLRTLDLEFRGTLYLGPDICEDGPFRVHEIHHIPEMLADILRPDSPIRKQLEQFRGIQKVSISLEPNTGLRSIWPPPKIRWNESEHPEFLHLKQKMEEKGAERAGRVDQLGFGDEDCIRQTKYGFQMAPAEQFPITRAERIYEECRDSNAS